MAYRDEVAADSPTHVWQLDEASGNFADSVGSATLTVTGTPTYSVSTALDTGSAVDFAGAYAQSADSTDWDGFSSMTVECLVRFSSIPGASVYRTVFNRTGTAGGSLAGEWSCHVRGAGSNAVNGILELNLGSDVEYVSTTTWTAAINTWYHLVWVWTGTAFQFYVNGSQLGTDVTASGTLGTTSTKGVTLAGYGGAVDTWAGTLDEVAFYRNTVLTGTRIAAHYAQIPVVPAIAHDASSRSGATDATSFTTTGTTSWTHTPVGTPKGVVVTVTQPLGGTDEVSGVTYGGVAMTRAISAVSTTTEVGRVYIYHLGAGIPTGAQTVAVTTTAGTAKQAHAFTMTTTNGSDTAVDSSNSGPNTVSSNPSITVTHTGTLSGWAGYAAHFYGGAAPVTTGLQAGETYQYGHDPGAAVGMVYTRHGGADAASSTYGYTTLTSDDQQIAAIVVKNLPIVVADTLPPAVVMAPRIPSY